MVRQLTYYLWSDKTQSWYPCAGFYFRVKDWLNAKTFYDLGEAQAVCQVERDMKVYTFDEASDIDSLQREISNG